MLGLVQNKTPRAQGLLHAATAGPRPAGEGGRPHTALPGTPSPAASHHLPLGTYTKKQWAAVSTHWASMRVPPQMWVVP